MKYNWLKIINFDDNYNYSYDNLAIILDFYFRDFVFVRYEDENIVVRNIYLNKEFLVKRNNNNLKMNAQFEDKDGIKTINRSLELYRYNYFDRKKGLQVFYEDFNKLNINKTTINLTKNRINLFDLLNITLEDTKRNTSLSFMTNIFNCYDINAMYGCPDLSFGLEIFRDDNKTIQSAGYYNDGIRCFDAYRTVNKFIPVSELAFNKMNDLYNCKKDLLKRKIKKTNKIGFI